MKKHAATAIVIILGGALLVSGACAKPAEPAEFAVTSFVVSDREVLLGESVTIRARVANTGETEGTYNAVLTVDGAEAEARSIPLGAGEEQEVRFVLPGPSAGVHEVALGGSVDTFRVLKAAEFKVGSLDIAPNTVSVGEEATVEVGVENVGEAGGSYLASLTVDGVVEQEEEVTLSGGAAGSVSFVVSRDSPGSYTVGVGGRKAVLEVLEPVRLPTGTLLATELHGMGTLTLENDLDFDAVAVLCSVEEPDIALLAVYVQANDSCTVERVRDGTYNLYVALGEDWDSDSNKFKREARYSRLTTECEWETTRSKRKIVYTVWEIPLRVIFGAYGTEMSEDEFPEL